MTMAIENTIQTQKHDEMDNIILAMTFDINLRNEICFNLIFKV
jgi:hypothetical protein